MPFDGSRESPEVQILDKMRELLATPDKWCKGTLQKGEALCLAGALHIAEGKMPGHYGPFSDIGQRVLFTLSLVAHTPNIGIAIGFNDLASTAHADVLALLDRAREELIECPVIP